MNLDAVRRWVLALFILLLPFYTLPSGLPQPSHWLIAVACALSARPLLGMLKTPDRTVLLPLLLLAGYTIVVNGYYSVAYPVASLEDLPLRRSVYILFNYGVFSVFLLQFRRGGARELRFFVACLFLTVISLAALSVWIPVDDAGRMVAFFNNPNQLGYLALTSMVIGFAFAFYAGVSVPLLALFTVSCLYLAARSLSVASIASISLLCLLVVIRTLLSRRSLALAMALAFACFGVLALFAPGGDLTTSLKRRAAHVEYQISNFGQHRHLDRLVEHPRYLILGAGQGAMQRFDDTDEVHSTFGTLLFSYGLPGTALFILFLYNLARKDIPGTLVFLVPALTFGVAHYGLRFSAFWVCLSVIYYTASTPQSGDDVAPLAILPARLKPAWIRGL